MQSPLEPHPWYPLPPRVSANLLTGEPQTRPPGPQQPTREQSDGRLRGTQGHPEGLTDCGSNTRLQHVETRHRVDPGTLCYERHLPLPFVSEGCPGPRWVASTLVILHTQLMAHRPQGTRLDALGGGGSGSLLVDRVPPALQAWLVLQLGWQEECGFAQKWYPLPCQNFFLLSESTLPPLPQSPLPTEDKAKSTTGSRTGLIPSEDATGADKGSQYELKDNPGVHPATFAAHTAPAYYPYGQFQYGDPGRPKNATRESTSTLKAWLNEHRKNPYPTKGEKIMLAIITKMTLTQVSTWFANARRRLKKENKMTEEVETRFERELHSPAQPSIPVRLMATAAEWEAWTQVFLFLTCRASSAGGLPASRALPALPLSSSTSCFWDFLKSRNVLKGGATTAGDAHSEAVSWCRTLMPRGPASQVPKRQNRLTTTHQMPHSGARQAAERWAVPSEEPLPEGCRPSLRPPSTQWPPKVLQPGGVRAECRAAETSSLVDLRHRAPDALLTVQEGNGFAAWKSCHSPVGDRVRGRLLQRPQGRRVLSGTSQFPRDLPPRTSSLGETDESIFWLDPGRAGGLLAAPGLSRRRGINVIQACGLGKRRAHSLVPKPRWPHQCDDKVDNQKDHHTLYVDSFSLTWQVLDRVWSGVAVKTALGAVHGIAFAGTQHRPDNRTPTPA
ncbi:hypothetical protein CB1_000849041 [Camelus ferus]|nr:hypothetical protein CB1_000849041 [Camelus ferus]